MSVRITKDVVVKCPNGHAVTLEPSSWSPDSYSEETYDSRMGSQTHHTFSADGIECPRCGKEFDASIEVWEYPAGQIETTAKSEKVVSDIEDVIEVQMD